MDVQFPKTAQGPAQLADAEALNKELLGYTHPNLHRRLEEDRPIHSTTSEESGSDVPETQPRDYQVGVYSVNSYKTITRYTHDEESTEVEIP